MLKAWLAADDTILGGSGNLRSRMYLEEIGHEGVCLWGCLVLGPLLLLCLLQAGTR